MNQRLLKFMEEGGKVYGCRFSTQALYSWPELLTLVIDRTPHQHVRHRGAPPEPTYDGFPTRTADEETVPAL